MLKLTNRRSAPHVLCGSRPLLDGEGKPLPGVFEPSITLEPGVPQLVPADRLACYDRADILGALQRGELSIEEVETSP